MQEPIENLKCNNYTYKEIADGIAILNYIGKATNISIPNYINNKPVTQIWKEAFDNKGLETAELPEHLEYIGEDAFYKNKLTEITIPQNVKQIGGGAFGRNQLEKLTIKADLKTIPMFCFVGNALSKLDLPESVNTLYNNCFAENNFTELTIPNHIETLSSAAFASSKNLKKVSLPEKFMSDRESIFTGSDFNSITFKTSN
ncbi:leucine-rich repeat domain-containing protein [Saccharicrinis aurantiacus]|uniref:leucine-rich repeat domain-containing protein n=1 Tax=Saccharicrinis aurantiacus TaxID=1849719 RepID=UPI00095022EC|nr:leucine-rich repeat domain-containing protein [Saccharicrinis aurantiacus]